MPSMIAATAQDIPAVAQPTNAPQVGAEQGIASPFPPGAIVIRQGEYRGAVPKERSVSTEIDAPAVGRDDVTAKVSLRCRAAAEMRIEGCEVTSEEPADSGFGKMSLDIADRFHVRPRMLKLSVKLGEVFTVPLAYRGIRAPIAGAHIYVPADWSRPPKREELFSPPVAGNISGEARISCSIEATGVLSGCAVLSENPAHLGFGQAALQSAPNFRFWPALADGKPTFGGTLRIPLKFGPAR